MEISWTDNAISMADNILQYTFNTFGKSQADKLKRMFVDITNRLKSYPNLGPIDSSLSDLGFEVHSLTLLKFIKMYYYIVNEHIFVAAVWNCRKDASSLHDLIKKQ